MPLLITTHALDDVRLKVGDLWTEGWNKRMIVRLADKPSQSKRSRTQAQPIEAFANMSPANRSVRKHNPSQSKHSQTQPQPIEAFATSTPANRSICDFNPSQSKRSQTQPQPIEAAPGNGCIREHNPSQSKHLRLQPQPIEAFANTTPEGRRRSPAAIVEKETLKNAITYHNTCVG
jgi:hypothetical protein